MVRMTIEMPEGALAALHKDPQGFAQELRLAAAVKWYELKLVSQGRAAEIAGIPRSEFLDALGRLGVSPFQYGADEILAEAGTVKNRGTSQPSQTDWERVDQMKDEDIDLSDIPEIPPEKFARALVRRGFRTEAEEG